MHAMVGYPELTQLEWRALDGTVLETATMPPGGVMNAVLSRNHPAPWLDDYELWVRPASSESWLRVLLVEQEKGVVSRFDL